MKAGATRWLLFPALALGGGLSAAAQEPPTDLVLGETLDVRLVELDVVVRDARGEPVRGLSAADFRVLEDGEVRPIGGFAERESSVRPTTDDRSVERAASETSEPLTLAVFLDYSALRPDRLARVLHFLERSVLPQLESAQMMLVANDRPLAVQIPLTSAPEDFLDRLRKLPPPPAESARGELDRQRAADEIGGGAGPAGTSTNLLDEGCNDARLTLFGELASYVDGVERRNQRSAAGLRALLTMLGGLRGRKVVFFVGEGLELQPGLEMAQRAANVCNDLQAQVPTLAGRSIAESLRALAAEANAHRVTLYTFDAAGARGDENLHPQLRQIRRTNLQDSMILLARETGGRFVGNVGDPRLALEELVNDSRHLYSIAYEPAPGTAGALRRIEVELVPEALRGLEVRHRRAVRGMTVADRLVARLFAALWLGESRSDLPLEVGAGPALEKGSLGARLRVPFDSLVLEPPESGSFEARLFAMARRRSDSARTQPKEIFELVTPGRLEQARARGAFEFVIDMDLPPGDWDIALGVRDESTSRTGVAVLREVVVD